MPRAKHRYSVFVFLRALPSWLALPRGRRNEIATAALSGALKDDQVKLRYFDAEAYSGFCSDIALFETNDLTAYYHVMERLRDTPLFATPYFELVQIIPAIEDGVREFEQSEAEAAA